MKLLLQRASHAEVKVDGDIVGKIARGLVLFIGVEQQDTLETCQRAAQRVLDYRLFSDSAGKMNLSVQNIEGGILAISQFTLAANTQKGLRPSFSSAMPPEQAQVLYEETVRVLREAYHRVATGVFGADMQVALVNDGPVTFMLELK